MTRHQQPLSPFLFRPRMPPNSTCSRVYCLADDKRPKSYTNLLATLDGLTDLIHRDLWTRERAEEHRARGKVGFRAIMHLTQWQRQLTEINLI